ncbi:MAG TPA: TIM barrel protein [Phycicoccus sp.]|nr:TIM barrel protein [Phycicoccus sp.]HQH07225.1 TIM barrel protein [Phycicoccus sp.]HQK30818.1 TIM barrel protein [Phycicoccus sp.]HQV92256.1 TIM barrel protein [Phycicoccus sp.]HQY95932.1 TIM barrel protein [Phycicoccus sp.]
MSSDLEGRGAVGWAAESWAAESWAARPGLCSVTLRRKSASEVIAIAAAAGLHSIEWGADVHAPPGDPSSAADRARLVELGDLTRASGLRVASLGSYWRAGVTPLPDLVAAVSSATALAAPRVRVWAGEVGTAEADDALWDKVVHDLRVASRHAADHGVELSLEFHPDTLTDSVESTIELLERVGSSNLRTHWQPRLDEEVEASVAGLERLLPWLSAVHVFSWWPGAHRLPLSDRAHLWSAALDLLMRSVPPCDLLLEFVEQDDVQALDRDARTLRTLLSARHPQEVN